MTSDKQREFEQKYSNLYAYQVSMEGGNGNGESYLFISTADRLQEVLVTPPQSFKEVIPHADRIIIEKDANPVIIEKLTLERIASLYQKPASTSGRD